MRLSELQQCWSSGLGVVVSERWRVRRLELLRYVSSALGDVEVSTLTPTQLFQIQRHIVGDLRLSPTTANHCVHEALRALLRDAEIGGLLEVGFRHRLYPAVSRLRRHPREDWEPFRPGQPEKIVRAFTSRRPCFVPLVAFAFATGLRPSELAGLRWVSVDLADRWLRVREARDGHFVTQGKTFGARRNLRLTRAAVRAIEPLHVLRHDPQDYVFLGTKAAAVDLHNFTNRWWRPIVHELDGVTYRVFKATRHTAITRALMSGRKTPEQIAHYFGTSVRMLYERYYRYIDDGEEWDSALG